MLSSYLPAIKLRVSAKCVHTKWERGIIMGLDQS